MFSLYRFASVMLLGALCIPGNQGSCIDPGRSELLEHYLVWSDYWRGTTFAAKSPSEFQVVSAGESLICHSRLLGATFVIVGQHVSSRTCAADWETCVDTVVPRMPVDPAGSVLGRVGPRVRKIQQGDACRFSLRSIRKLTWRPSRDTGAKRRLLASIGEALRKTSGYFGEAVRIDCADFNVLDPSVWAVAQVRSHRTVSMILVGVDLFGEAEPVVVVNREATAEDAVLIAKIRDLAIPIPLR